MGLCMHRFHRGMIEREMNIEMKRKKRRVEYFEMPLNFVNGIEISLCNDHD